jgi:hypothetical protein
MTEHQKERIAQLLFRQEQEAADDVKEGIEMALRVLATPEEQKDIGERYWRKRRESMKDVQV